MNKPSLPVGLPLGSKFTRLTTTSEVYKQQATSRRIVDAVCECGAHITVRVDALTGGRSRSCGCYHKEIVAKAATTHGHTSEGSTTPEFRSWDHMLQRCNNPNNDQYHDYGGRGVLVCDRWLVFANFLDDMGRRPEGTSLDRIGNGLLYSKEHCRWATRSQQADGRRCTRWVTISGARITLKAASELFGVKFKTLSARWAKGLRGVDLLTTVGVSK